MPKTAPSDACPDRCDDWFDQHEAAYQSELSALRAARPEAGPVLNFRQEVLDAFVLLVSDPKATGSSSVEA
ncbi:hypothetical protein GGQ07_002902 [Salinibacter ruber]|uniref:hypothetical protein n=1 Tax=Salinibacter ruber TaxID=146919 RepID=UPI002168C4C4|nr:hypothetical protein [Salinibacter ruber]MCS4116067.1 hypothetical protein [Salinibacter ruber]MCS4181445.1 hypothetical protein [Salinibacter ruber]